MGCFFLFCFVFPTDGSYFYTNGEKTHSEVSKWSNEVHSYQWNLNGLQDKIVSYESAQLCLKTVQKPSLLKCWLSASLLPFSHSLISLSIHFFHFCYLQIILLCSYNMDLEFSVRNWYDPEQTLLIRYSCSMLRADRKDMLFNVMNNISPYPRNHALQPLKSELTGGSCLEYQNSPIQNGKIP